jgi:hypothetical protein
MKTGNNPYAIKGKLNADHPVYAGSQVHGFDHFFMEKNLD